MIDRHTHWIWMSKHYPQMVDFKYRLTRLINLSTRSILQSVPSHFGSREFSSTCPLVTAFPDNFSSVFHFIELSSLKLQLHGVHGTTFGKCNLVGHLCLLNYTVFIKNSYVIWVDFIVLHTEKHFVLLKLILFSTSAEKILHGLSITIPIDTIISAAHNELITTINLLLPI